MRILQIVTLVTPEGAFGGPVRVAVNQSTSLRAQGHSVELLAGVRGYSGEVPRTIDGSQIRLFPAPYLVPKVGFAGLSSPAMLFWLIRNLRQFDVVHVHMARDLVTLPAALVALICHGRVYLQTHGMIDPSTRRSALLLDRLVTRRVLRAARAVFALTLEEHRDLLKVEPNIPQVRIIPNGVPAPVAIPAAFVVSSGHHAAEDEELQIEVLFLARLHARKRPQAFVHMARAIASDFEGVRFRMVGPDEGEGPAVSRMIADSPTVDIDWEGSIPPERTAERLSAATIYVLPALNEPFPMSVLEAMAAGVPVVVTESCGLAPYLQRHAAGIVTDSSSDSLQAAVRSLLSSPDLRHQLSRNAKRLVLEEFSMDRVASQLVESYNSTVVSSA